MAFGRRAVSAYDLSMTTALDTPLTAVLGGRTSAALAKAFGHRTVDDVLNHVPRRYAHRGELTDLTRLPVDENVTIVAEVLDVRERPMRAKRGSILEVRISDGRGNLGLTFFNQAWRAEALKPGVRGMFAGKISHYRGRIQLAHPDYELFDAVDGDGDGDGESPSDKTIRAWAEHPIPVYAATATVASWQVQRSVALVLDGVGDVDDPVPAWLARDRHLMSAARAYECVHRPTTDSDWKHARDTLRFHEAFVLQAALLERRREAKTRRSVARESTPGGFLDRFDDALPFSLTNDQNRVGREISADLAQRAPMNRLVHGEVGSGKTYVALRAMVAVADSGGQSAFLAPTEVLAAQHARSIVAALGPDLAAALMPQLLTGHMSVPERRKALLRVVSGQARIVIGTHALLGEAVTFFDLGLAVIDEQHRFGVDQREALRRKGATPPHVLVLTATPIPRTVAMTVFGDLDVSTISELPAGRREVASHVVPLAERPGWRARVWQRVSEEVAAGRQAFVVCPAIDSATEEDSDGDERDSSAAGSELTGGTPGASTPVGNPLTTVADTHAMLSAHSLFKNTRIETVHGRLTSEQKDRVMRDFVAGAIDVLIATTVIEVGVDVPNASIMVVLDADRFGVSQLHQLRGRIGRGEVPGLALFVTTAAHGTVARERVESVASTLDGFALAQKDLELRREGDVLGNAQSGGVSSLRLLRVATDGDLIEEARHLAARVLDDDPHLTNHPALAHAISRRLDTDERASLGKT